MENKKIKINDYPFLETIMWQCNPNTFIDEKIAFNVCEREWDWIDFKNLTEKEKCFLNHIKDKYGDGVFLHD